MVHNLIIVCVFCAACRVRRERGLGENSTLVQRGGLLRERRRNGGVVACALCAVRLTACCGEGGEKCAGHEENKYDIR